MDPFRFGTALALISALAISQHADSRDATSRREAKPIAFDKIDRSIGALPELRATQPLYGLFLFGKNGEHRVWAVLDKSARDAEGYDVLYLDRDADGDLTGDDERIAGKASRTGADRERLHMTFRVDELRDPGSDAVHTEFELKWTAEYVRLEMRWRGDKITMGVFGPERETYQNFGTSPKTAPILVPGHDRPFQFQHWMCDVLARGDSTDFKVFVGNRGDRTGAFLCVDDEFLPADEYVQATLIYRDQADKERRVRVKLTERC